MGFDQVAWLPLCVGLTALGLFLSWVAGRRRGAAAAVRGVAWSLLPLAAYLTGVLPLVWNTGTAVAGWVGRLVFSPQVWVGAALAGLAVVLFMISGMLRNRAVARERAARQSVAGPGARQVPAGARPASLPSGQSAPTRAPSRQPAQTGRRTDAGQATQQQTDPLGDDDFSEVEEILRRRGIT